MINDNQFEQVWLNSLAVRLEAEELRTIARECALELRRKRSQMEEARRISEGLREQIASNRAGFQTPDGAA